MSSSSPSLFVEPPEPLSASVPSPAPSVTTDVLNIYSPQSLTIRIAYKCNIRCKFCYQGADLNNETALDEERMLGMVREGREAGFIRLGISGGEAFLYAKSMAKIIKLAKQIGYQNISIVSNGFWGKSVRSTRNVLNLLKNAGFTPPQDMLSMSAGEYHQEWIALSNARNIIDAYYTDYNLPFTIDFEYSKGKDHLVSEFTDYLCGEGIPEHTYKIRPRTIIAKLGRGKDIDEQTMDIKPIKAFGICPSIGRFVVQPEGYVVPCCGFNRYIEGLSLGSIYEHSVSEIISMASTNLVNRYLTHVPLRDMHKELSKHFDLPSDFSVNCELCEVIFGKQQHIDHLRKIAGEMLNDGVWSTSK